MTANRKCRQLKDEAARTWRMLERQNKRKPVKELGLGHGSVYSASSETNQSVNIAGFLSPDLAFYALEFSQPYFFLSSSVYAFSS